MSRFRAALRRAARDLDLPRPVRAAILLELAGDLEAAYDDLRRRGIGELEAERRAEILILGSGEMVRRLDRMHSGTWGEWSHGIGDRLTSPGGLVLLVVAVLPVLAVAAGQAVPWFLAGPQGLFAWPGDSTSRFLAWLVVSAAAGVALVTLHQAVRLAMARLPTRSGPDLLVLLSVLAPAFGLLGLCTGLQGISASMVTARTASAPWAVGVFAEPSGEPIGEQRTTSEQVTASEQVTPEADIPGRVIPGPVVSGAGFPGPTSPDLLVAVFERLARGAALLAAGLLVGIMGALSWFVIVSRASSLIAREADALLDGDPPADVIRRSAGIPLVRRRKA